MDDKSLGREGAVRHAFHTPGRLQQGRSQRRDIDLTLLQDDVTGVLVVEVEVENVEKHRGKCVDVWRVGGVGEGRKEAVPAWIDEQLIHPRLNHFRHDRVLFRLAAPVRVDRQDIGGLSPVRYKHSIYTVR